MLSSTECITWLVLFLTESVAIVTVNLLTIVIFIKKSNLRTRSLYLVIHLTVADLFVVVFSGSVAQIYSLMACNFVQIDYSSQVQSLQLAGSYFFPLVSLTNIAVISLERCHATFCPLRHRVTKTWVYFLAIAAIWVLPGIVQAILQLPIYLITIDRKYYFSFPSYCYLCLFSVFVSYTLIFLKFRCRAHPQRLAAASLRQRKLTVTLLVTTLVSLVLWLPFNIHFCVACSTPNLHSFLSPLQPIRLKNALLVLLHANSLVNSIVYSIRIPEFKKALLSLRKREERDAKDNFPLKGN